MFELQDDINSIMIDKILSTYKNFPTFREFLEFLELEHSPKNVRLVSSILKENGIKHSFKSRCGVISKVSKDELQCIVDNSSSIVDVLKRFNLRNCGGNANTLKRRCADLNIDLSKMFGNKRASKIVRTSYEGYDDYISKVSSRKDIKKYIISNGLIEYKCAECHNNGTHNGKPLVLQLDHIDGDNSNNELSNLRFLCPNCHSQTMTFCGHKNRIRVKTYCSQCGCELSRKNKTSMCRACNAETGNYSKIASNRESSIIKAIPDKTELENLLINNSLSGIGRKHGVSDNAVRKWCIKYGIDLKKNKFSK